MEKPNRIWLSRCNNQKQKEMANDYYIKSVDFTSEDGERLVTATLSNNAVVKISPCYESWEQYGCTLNEKRVTVGLADIVNEWLHGNAEEPESDVNNEIIAVATEWLKENQSEVFGDIADYDSRSEHAMTVMDEMRCPLSTADNSLYNAMKDKLEDWCYDNDFDPDDFDPDNIIF